MPQECYRIIGSFAWLGEIRSKDLWGRSSGFYTATQNPKWKAIYLFVGLKIKSALECFAQLEITLWNNSIQKWPQDVLSHTVCEFHQNFFCHQRIYSVFSPKPCLFPVFGFHFSFHAQGPEAVPQELSREKRKGGFKVEKKLPKFGLGLFQSQPHHPSAPSPSGAQHLLPSSWGGNLGAGSTLSPLSLQTLSQPQPLSANNPPHKGTRLMWEDYTFPEIKLLPHFSNL